MKIKFLLINKSRGSLVGEFDSHMEALLEMYAQKMLEIEQGVSSKNCSYYQIGVSDGDLAYTLK